MGIYIGQSIFATVLVPISLNFPSRLLKKMKIYACQSQPRNVIKIQRTYGYMLNLNMGKQVITKKEIIRALRFRLYMRLLDKLF